ncbi:MAG: 50S ribosomal protein L23 [Lentisphaeria bacterium]|nr:50S ribosomal protein L23 [Lentisphaeria bacterium]
MIKNSPYDIVKHIMMTEKSALLKAENKYAFKVAPKATKLEVAAAVQEIYGVKVKSVNMMNFMGKLKRAGRSPIPGRRASWKKAVVTLSEGTIDLA